MKTTVTTKSRPRKTARTIASDTPTFPAFTYEGEACGIRPFGTICDTLRARGMTGAEEAAVREMLILLCDMARGGWRLDAARQAAPVALDMLRAGIGTLGGLRFLCRDFLAELPAIKRGLAAQSEGIVRAQVDFPEVTRIPDTPALAQIVHQALSHLIGQDHVHPETLAAAASSRFPRYTDDRDRHFQAYMLPVADLVAQDCYNASYKWPHIRETTSQRPWWRALEWAPSNLCKLNWGA